MSMVSKESGIKTRAYINHLHKALDTVPETRGMGLVVSENGHRSIVRACAPKAPFALVNLHDNGFHAKPRSPAETVSTTKEWMGLGLAVGGAALSWIGVVGSAAISPETGGASLAATGLLWSGALASSAQVGNSVFRLWAIYNGRSRWISNLDHNAIYTNVNRAADVIGLIGAAGAVKETVATGRALAAADTSFTRALGTLNRQQRLRLTTELELQGAKRVAAVKINKVVKMRILDAFAGAYGTGTSSYNGVAHEIGVSIIHPNEEGK